MSIHVEIEKRCRELRLFPLEPAIPGDPMERSMFLSEEIKELVFGPWAGNEFRYRAGRLRGDLEDFIKGEWINVCLRPFKAKTAYMGLLQPPSAGTWDIRSRDPSPGIRVIGFFADKDIFIALRWAPRSVQPDWADRPPLGCAQSREWRDIILQSHTDWRNLFPSHPPISGDSNIHDYISNNVRLV